MYFSAADLDASGSRWVWLVQKGDSSKIVKTSDADTPLAHSHTALLTGDL